MNINSIVNQINNAINLNNISGNSENVSQSLNNGLNTLLSGENNMAVSGKIVGMEGNEILLSMGEDGLIKANVEGSLNAKIGDILTFSVKNSGSGKISLSPLFENTAMASTVSKALMAASMPDTAQNQYMVKSMMQEGLPIDKQSLYDMSRAMNANATSDVLDLAKMTRLNIPLNEEMVKQFENYQNFEHEVTNALKDISDSLLETTFNLFNEGDNVEGLKLFSNIGEALAVADSYANEASVSDLNNGINSTLEELLLSGEDALSANNSKPLDEMLKDIIKFSQNELAGDKTDIVNDKDNSIDKTPDKSINIDGNSNSNLKTDLDNINVKNDNTVNTVNADTANNSTVNQDYSNRLLKSLISQLKNTDFDSKSPEFVKDLTDKVKTLINNDEFKDVLKKAVLDKYMLRPEEVSEDGKVSKLYERMNSQIKELQQMIESQGKNDTPLSSTVNNLNSNLEFMNELNQTFNYVQIPLKMMNQEATGELYVYTNKKKLSRDDGNVSALLHLDMDNLGPVDVHVQMNSENNVKTKFYLKDDASLDLIANNIDLLNKRLENRGYNMSAEFINKEDNKSVMDTILENNRNISLISSGAFDARA